MPSCGCSKACNCLVEENGVLIQDQPVSSGTVDPIDSNRIGWRDNVVAGSGSASSPFTISFVDSLEYRPWAAEAKETGTNVTNWTANPIVYNSPDGTLIVWNASVPALLPVSQTGFLVGARAVINSGGAVLNAITMEIDFDSNAPDDGSTVVGGYTAGASVDPIITASGYVSPLRGFPTVSSGLIGGVEVSFASTFGGWTVTSLQLWLITV